MARPLPDWMQRSGTRERGDPLPDFRSIYESEVSYVWVSLSRLGVRERDLEDLTHEVFAKLFQNFHVYDPSRPLRPWLFGIAARIAWDYRELSRNRLETPAPPIERPDPRAGPEEELSAQEDRALVLRALDELSMDRRMLLVMHDLNGHSMPEIAKILSNPINTLYSRLRMARADFLGALLRLRRTKP
jgi:RNA polymerase sigma-70 factor (ECF subfamily)